MPMNKAIFEACERAAEEIHSADLINALDEEIKESILEETTDIIYNEIIKVVMPMNKSLVIIDWTENQISVE